MIANFCDKIKIQLLLVARSVFEGWLDQKQRTTLCSLMAYTIILISHHHKVLLVPILKILVELLR